MKMERNHGMSTRKAGWKRTVSSVSMVLAGLFTVLCVCGAVQTNLNKIGQQVELYAMGETVDIGKNFFTDASKAPDGYSIRVNSAELADYEELLAEYGVTMDELWYSERHPAPQYTYLVNVTIRNEDNETGAIMAWDYAIYDRALKIPADIYLWGLMDENYFGEPGFRLQTNSELTITIPFTPMPIDTGTNLEEVTRRMESETFYFGISEFPVRKMIELARKGL